MIKNIKKAGFKKISTVIAVVMIMAIMGCDDDNEKMNDVNPGNISIATGTSLGNILVDGNGMTLYVFALDVDGQSQCQSGACQTNWPAYHAEEINPGSGLDPADFETITLTGSGQQTTYKGWPLYHFAGDAAAGDVKGDGINGLWFAAKPDYSLMIASGQLVGEDGKMYTGDYNEGEGNTVYFTDSEGRTLYIFINDEMNTNNFTKPDFSNNSVWPIFYTDIDQLPSGMDPADFGEIDVFGESQLTYLGWPVYYFGSDSQRGDTKGISFPVPGVWPVLNNDTQPAQ